MVGVWELDRLSRSLKNLLSLLTTLDAARHGYRLATKSIDMTTAAERRMMQTIGNFAWLQRAIICAWTRAGLLPGRKSEVESAKLLNVSEPTGKRVTATARQQVRAA